MSEMIERVAARLCEADGNDPETVKAISALRVYAEHGEDKWSGYLAAARDAIEAMREPTIEMVRSGERSIQIGPFKSARGAPLPIWTYVDTEEVFGAMIDAALAEGK